MSLRRFVRWHRAVELNGFKYTIGIARGVLLDAPEAVGLANQRPSRMAVRRWCPNRCRQTVRHRAYNDRKVAASWIRALWYPKGVLRMFE